MTKGGPGPRILRPGSGQRQRESNPQLSDLVSDASASWAKTSAVLRMPIVGEGRPQYLCYACSAIELGEHEELPAGFEPATSRIAMRPVDRHGRHILSLGREPERDPGWQTGIDKEPEAEFVSGCSVAAGHQLT